MIKFSTHSRFPRLVPKLSTSFKFSALISHSNLAHQISRSLHIYILYLFWKMQFWVGTRPIGQTHSTAANFDSKFSWMKVEEGRKRERGRERDSGSRAEQSNIRTTYWAKELHGCHMPSMSCVRLNIAIKCLHLFKYSASLCGKQIKLPVLQIWLLV